MLRRANQLVARARERIRAAAEHDPHGWPERDHHHHAIPRGHDEPAPGPPEDGAPPHADGTPVDHADVTRPPVGSPEPGAPDLDVGGVSGPPDGERPADAGQRGRRIPGFPRRGPAPGEVPSGLRTAASWSWRLIVVLGALFALAWAASYIAVVLVPVIVAILLAALFQPGAAALVRHGWRRSLAAATMLVFGLGVVAGIIALVVQQFAAGFSDLAKQVTEGLAQIKRLIVQTFPVTQSQLDGALNRLQDTLVKNQGTLATGALNTAATVGEVVTGILLALFTLFFFLKDGRSIWLWIIGLCPAESRAYLDEAARRSWRTLISYVRATVAVAAFDAIFIGTGLAILGAPLAVPLAALVFLGAFIPIIGSFIAGSVAVLVALVANGPIVALIALAIVVGVMQVEAHILQPLLLGRAVRVHPLAVVLSIAAGLLIAGIFGALIAVPTVACANVAGTYLARRHDGPRPPEPRPERARKAVGVR